MSVDRLQELRKRKRPQGDTAALDNPNATTIEMTNAEGEKVDVVRENGGDDVDQQIELYRPINALINQIQSSSGMF